METSVKLKCDMIKGCCLDVEYIDNKGFVYCHPHGVMRKQYIPCRKLKMLELKRLKEGKTVEKF